MKIRTLIVDDEPPARARIRSLVSSLPDFEIVGECSGGDAAIGSILELRPDLVFLDVQMPEVDGFGVLRAVAAEHVPQVVFVTAFDQYAVKAFDAHAVDYLLKPFTRKRFVEAVARVRGALGERGRAARERVVELVHESGSSVRLVVRANNRLVILRSDEIDWIQAAANYVSIHTAKREYLVRESIVGIQQRLGGSDFVRIHRSTVVNIDRIAEIRPEDGSDWLVVLRNGRELRVGRTYREPLFELLKVRPQ